MSQWAIVCIPGADDYTWKISSEKIPHMTLLFLGEQSDTSMATRIAEFLGHTARTSMDRFGLSVDRRGTLGPDNADVIFFEKEFTQKIADIRALLLQNDDINAAYLSTEQYPEWTPHLTLGYPAKPAKADTRDYPGIRWVSFDKVALWTNDFSGVEFPLKSNEGLMMSHSAKADEFLADAGLVRSPGEEMLEHFGIKGMKWGIRRPIGKGGRVAKGAPAGSETDVNVARDKAASSPHAKKSNDKLKSEIDLLRGPEALSNSDLKALNNRLQMEQTYADLVEKRKARQPKTKGEKFIEGLKVAGNVATSAVAFANSPAGKLILDSLASKGGTTGAAASAAGKAAGTAGAAGAAAGQARKTMPVDAFLKRPQSGFTSPTSPASRTTIVVPPKRLQITK